MDGKAGLGLQEPKRMKLSTAASAAPVVEGDGDIFAPLRALRARYSFNEARFHNLITMTHDVIAEAKADEKPKLHARLKRLETTRNYYGGAVLALSVLIPA
jgi:hypothetical protein